MVSNSVFSSMPSKYSSVVLPIVTYQTFMAQNNDDECFSRDYTKDVYDRGNWDLWGNYVGYKPKQKTLSVSESILDTWEILPRP